MQTIVLLMRRKPIAQGFTQSLKSNPQIHIVYEPHYQNAHATIGAHEAGVALIEIGETDEYAISRCLLLCKTLRKKTPRCKLVLLCPEQNEESVLEAVAAKKDGRIDDFMFYDTSFNYLAAKLLSML